MRAVRLILITGLPASGKTTLARTLAGRYRVPVISKDRIKEPLLDVLGAKDRAASRQLSDASFAVMFAIACELVAAEVELILEGNFRAGEHEEAVRVLAAGAQLAQVLCEVEESDRLARISARKHDLTRHPGHRDSELAGSAAAGTPFVGFLEVPSTRFVYKGGAAPESPSDNAGVLGNIDRWWAGTLSDS